MIYDIWMFLAFPMIISVLCVLSGKNYWDMAGTCLIMVSILEIYNILPVISVIMVIVGAFEIYYGEDIKRKNKEKDLDLY